MKKRTEKIVPKGSLVILNGNTINDYKLGIIQKIDFKDEESGEIDIWFEPQILYPKDNSVLYGVIREPINLKIKTMGSNEHRNTVSFVDGSIIEIFETSQMDYDKIVDTIQRIGRMFDFPEKISVVQAENIADQISDNH
jgi:hypothetical protein